MNAGAVKSKFAFFNTFLEKLEKSFGFSEGQAQATEVIPAAFRQSGRRVDRPEFFPAHFSPIT